MATALYITELAPRRVRGPLVILVELLAAVPSVVYGLWGIFVLIPWLRDHLFQWLKHTLGFLPFKQAFRVAEQQTATIQVKLDPQPSKPEPLAPTGSGAVVEGSGVMVAR